jgi:hypothetical protein
MAVPDTARRGAESAVFESLTQTDSAGRYRLDNISPGRYYIAAGFVAAQTFHPGTSDQSAATIVTVTRNSPVVSGMDFTVAPIPSAAQGATQPLIRGGIVCCRLQGRLFMEDKSPVPNFPTPLNVISRRGGTGVDVGATYFALGYFPITYSIGTTVEMAVDGLPPGYVLKSVAYGGKDFGLNAFKVDGQSLATLDLMLGYEPVSTLKKVTARGKVVNPAPELKVTSIRFASTIPSGPALVARLQPDGSFEFTDIPVGAYGWGVLDARGSASTSPNIFVIRDDVSDLKIDLRNNPFPEFYGVRPDRTAFTDGKSSEITGVITQKITLITGDQGYFRINVKDASTGGVIPWAVFFEHEWQIPKIVVGETITVPGVSASDGTNRLSAHPF